MDWYTPICTHIGCIGCGCVLVRVYKDESSVYARVCLCMCVCMCVCVLTGLHAYIRMICIGSPEHVWADMLSILVLHIHVVSHSPETKCRRWQKQYACSQPCVCAMVTFVFVLLLRLLLHHA